MLLQEVCKYLERHAIERDMLLPDRETIETIYYLNCKYVQESTPNAMVAQALKGYGEPQPGKKAPRPESFDGGGSGYTNFGNGVSISSNWRRVKFRIGKEEETYERKCNNSIHAQQHRALKIIRFAILMQD